MSLSARLLMCLSLVLGVAIMPAVHRDAGLGPKLP